MWTPLLNQPAFTPSTMLLLTDGGIMTQAENDSAWWKLAPNAFGDYISGTWIQLASMHEARLYYASAVLADGRVFVAGGEDSGSGIGVDLKTAEIYDPLANNWTKLADAETVLGAQWDHIGDAPCCVLQDGRVLLGNINHPVTAIYDPVANTWAAGATKNDRSSEETWTLLQDGSVLSVECNAIPKAEKYVPALNQWVPAGNTPAPLVQASSTEIGPAIRMYDGRTFAIGATGNTALYIQPALPNMPGAWAVGPAFPLDATKQLMEAKDAPAALLPNGRVLCVAGPAGQKLVYPGPSSFFEFDGAVLHPIAPPNNFSNPPYAGRMMLTPTGHVLFAALGEIHVYTAAGGPNAAWRPQIAHVADDLEPGHQYTLYGRQLNGLSQAVSYGDDATMATNYPLVRIRNFASGKVVYCRTSGHSTMAVATGASLESTHLVVPSSIETGASELVVVANGIPSRPFPIEIGKRRRRHCCCSCC